MNYYKRHLGDYAKDTGHLTPLEHGVYTLLLDRYYSTERPIPEAEACRVARAQTAADRAAVASVLREYFRLVDGEWHHNYADRVIKEASEKADANRKNGKKGGRPATQTEPKDNPEITQMVPKEEPKKTLAISHKPLATSHKPIEKTSGEPSAAPTNAVWESYAEAYTARYGEPPIRNAKSNGILKTFLTRIPAAEAPMVAAFYVRHPSAFYATKMHPLNVMLDDAEKLRTEWATNRAVTSIEARNQERTASNPFARMVGEQREAIGGK